MSRSAPLAWTAALAAAAYPTWEIWKTWFVEEYYSKGHYGAYIVRGCVRLFESIDRSPFPLLRIDLNALTELATTWAVPLLAVLVALVRRPSATAGHQAAWVLTLIALARPLSADYRGDGVCAASLPLFSLDWFEALSGGWGLWEFCLLAAALLVLLTSAPSAPLISGRRALTAVVDLLVVYTLVALAPLLTGIDSLRGGLLRLLELDEVTDDPARLLVLVLPVGYLLWRHGRRGTAV